MIFKFSSNVAARKQSDFQVGSSLAAAKIIASHRRKKKSQPGEEEAEVVAGGGEDGVGPDVSTACSLDKLSADADPASELPHASFKHVADA